MITDEMLSKAIRELDEEMMASLPDPKDCKHVFSPEFERKMQKLLNKAKYFVVYTTLKRVACIFIALLVSASMFLAVNPSARAAVVDWIQERFGEFYHYFFVGEEVPEETDADVTNEIVEPTVLDGSGLTTEGGSYCLGWVPDGYTLLNSVKSDNVNTVIYVSDSHQMLYFTYLLGSNSNSVYTGVGEYKQKFVSSANIYAEILLAIDEDDTNVITWLSDDGKIRFTISSYLGEADLIKMAQSVEPEKNN